MLNVSTKIINKSVTFSPLPATKELRGESAMILEGNPGISHVGHFVWYNVGQEGLVSSGTLVAGNLGLTDLPLSR